MLQIQPVQHDILALIREASDYMSYSFKIKKQNLILELPLQTYLLDIEPRRIRQVLVNLLDNASKYTQISGTIILRVKEYPENIVIEVEDNGIGIPPDKITHLFNPYSRLETKKENHAGLGIGLALSKILINLHGGDIWATKGEESGSTFSFSLPIKYSGKIKGS
jgi:signal transduction histidine kinase